MISVLDINNTVAVKKVILVILLPLFKPDEKVSSLRMVRQRRRKVKYLSGTFS